MIVKKIAFGNSKEAFIESRLTDRVNIIYSDDNNKGKTLLIQGLMYSLGYEAIFPVGFDYKSYFFYSEIEIDNILFEFIRKDKTFVVRKDQFLQIFSSVSEFKHFFNSEIHTLPIIIKDHKARTVDLTLFFELFFVGQDKRSPSDLISKGQFNKADFKSMVLSIAQLDENETLLVDVKETKEKIKSKKLELKSLRKKIQLINQNPQLAEIVSRTYETEVFQTKINTIRALNKEISDIRKSRQRVVNRRSKLEALISELRSLNQVIDAGSIVCGDCGSDNIVYFNKDIKFDISNADVRSRILESITNSIGQNTEIIEDKSAELDQVQKSLAIELETSPPSFQEIVTYQDQINSEINYDDEAFRLVNEIEMLKEILRSQENSTELNKQEQIDLITSIVSEMQKLYQIIDPTGQLAFDALFTKKDTTFSGSDEQIYYFGRLIALSKILKHPFPLIMDSFRSGEISSQKEDLMIDEYKRLEKQVIITSTLKREEYSVEKYEQITDINAINYSSHQDSKILKSHYLDEFNEIISQFGGIIQN